MTGDLDEDLLRDLPVEIWTESDIGQSLLRLAQEGRCKHIRINSTLGRFEPIDAGAYYAALANKIDRAHAGHLNSFGGSPRGTSRNRAELEILLREEVTTIIAALRLASSVAELPRSGSDRQKETC